MKTREKTREKIIAAIKANPNITSKALAEITGITIKGIEWQIKSLKSKGILLRINGDNGGHWEVIIDNK